MRGIAKIGVILALEMFLAGMMTWSVAAETCKENPRVMTDEQKRISLFLPDSVREMIRLKLPDLKVPGPSDVKGLWATETPSGSLPYFAQGDYNGDGRKDFALVLSDQKDYWLVVFQQATDCTYSVAYKTGGSFSEGITLQSVFVRTIPKGEEKVMQSIGPGGKQVESMKYKFETDALEWTTVGGSVSLVYWKNGKYQLMDFGSE
jgi:hypothetical protein